MSEALTTIEAESFAKLEARVEAGLMNFIDVGNALSEIRDRKLYRATHPNSFEEYCRERWGFTDNYARRLIQSSEVVKSVPIGTVRTESQARELSRVEPARRQEVVEKASIATGGKITAAALREAARTELVVEPARINPERFSQAMMHADNACACIDKISSGDPQMRAALARVTQHIAARLNTQ
jgi:hypothetical protein